MIQLGLLDDHLIFAQGVAQLFANNETRKLKFISNSQYDCLQKLEENPIDILLCDLQIGKSNAIAFLKKFKENNPGLKIIMLSMFEDFSMVELALKEGANSYVLKSSGMDILFDSINDTAIGKRYIDPNINQNRDNLPYAPGKLAPKLTAREKEILHLIVNEHRSAEIAVLLNVSVKTIEAHRSNLFAKFGVSSVVGLVKNAIKFRVVS